MGAGLPGVCAGSKCCDARSSEQDSERPGVLTEVLPVLDDMKQALSENDPAVASASRELSRKQEGHDSDRDSGGRGPLEEFYESALGPSRRPAGERYCVTLHKDRNSRLGINVDHFAGGTTLPIVEVTGGLVLKWNQANPNSQVCEGDHIVEVNGVRDNVDLMMERCKNDQVLRLTLRRPGPLPPPPAVVADRHPQIEDKDLSPRDQRHPVQDGMS
eukprot:TRINITY_DN90949_c0_g1_i1.p1 TRINITY_DN90949_c0_g1~~TRINITY_DN90949_c0_g1_i1.p1  ORF type:complete len:216 (+),score=36.49 TRINITY_DN90949_c0_g1_i1:74-721(+)